MRSLPPGNQLNSTQRKRRRQALGELFDAIRPGITELQDRIGESLEKMRYRELALAMDAGLLTIDPLPDIDVRNVGDDADDDIAARYFARVQQALTSQNTYPLFDTTTNNLVNLGVEEGIFSPPPSARRRGRDASLATGLFDRLPNFEHANMSEILDIRQDNCATRSTGSGKAFVRSPKTLKLLPKIPNLLTRSTRHGLPPSRLHWLKLKP